MHVVVLDMDGTTLNERSQLAPQTIDAVRRVRAAGVQVVVASGRARLALQPIIDDLCLPGKVLTICFNGACAMYLEAGRPSAASAPLFATPLDRRAACGVLDVCEDLGGLPVVYVCADNTYVARNLQSQHEVLLSSFEGPNPDESGTSSTRVDPDCRALLDKELPLKLVALSLQPERDAERARELLQKLGVDVHVIAAEVHLEFLPRGVNKGSALEALCEQLGLQLNQITAFGDNYNDIEMLTVAGEGVAMANARCALSTRWRKARVTFRKRALNKLLESLCYKLRRSGRDRVKVIADRVSQWSNEEYGVARELEAITLRRTATRATL